MNRSKSIFTFVVLAVTIALLAPAANATPMSELPTPLSEVHEFVTGLSADTGPNDIASGADGNLWLTELYTGRIARIDTKGGFTEFSDGITEGSHPWGITAGPDGNLWFTEGDIFGNANRIGRITTGGEVTEFSAGISPKADLRDITTGPDGNLWFTETGIDRIGRITTSGVVTEFAAGISAGAQPINITSGPDGNLWFTERGTNSIGRITPAGVVTEFSNGISPSAQPNGITTGPDGNIWFTELSGGGSIGKITPSGAVTEYMNTIPGGGQSVEIATGPDGNLWFTDVNAAAIGRITTDGVITPFPTGGRSNATQQSIATGPDGNLWFTGFFNNNIAWIGTGIAPASVKPPTVVSAGKSGGENKCSGDAWSTWAGWRPAETSVSWSRNGAVIAGASGREYRSTESDTGSELSCTVHVRYPFVKTFAAAASAHPASAKRAWLITCKRKSRRSARRFNCGARAVSKSTQLRGRVRTTKVRRGHKRYRVRYVVRGGRIEVLSERQLHRGTYRLRRGHRSYLLTVAGTPRK